MFQEISGYWGRCFYPSFYIMLLITTVDGHTGTQEDKYDLMKAILDPFLTLMLKGCSNGCGGCGLDRVGPS